MAGDLITTDNQAQFGPSLLMGPGTGYVITGAGITGWEDSPGFDTTDVPRPSSDGSWPGKRYAGTRVVTIDVSIHPDNDPDGRDGRQLLRDLQRATRIHQSERELALRLRGETLIAYARINSRLTEPISTRYMGMGEIGIPLQFLATDPRRYALAEESVTVGPPVRSEGLLYTAVSGIDRLDWELATTPTVLDWGVDGSSGDVTAVNEGTESTSPLIVITGPCSTPAVTLTSDETGQLVLEYGIDLVASDTLTIDVRQGNVLLNAGTSDADRAYTVTPRSALLSEFMLPPGESRLAFRAASTSAGAGMTVSWRDAYM